VQRSWLHRLTATPMRTTSGQNWLQVMRTEAAHPKEGTPLTSHAPSPVPQLRVAGISGQNMVSSCYWPKIMSCNMSASLCVHWTSKHMWLSLALESVKLLNNAYVTPWKLVAVPRCRCTENLSVFAALFDTMSNPGFKTLESWNLACILTLICKKVAERRVHCSL